MPMSDEELIECRPTRWFYLRAGAMTLMFGVFFVLFMKDWKIGYPKKNEVYYTFQAFKEAKETFQEHEDASKTPEEWNEWASQQTIDFPEGEGLLPSGVATDAPWPEELTDYATYQQAFAEEGSKAIPPLWAAYTDERGWSSSTPEKSFNEKKIKEQLYFGIGSGVLMLIALFFLIRTSRRSMKVDREAFYAPDGRRIPFGAMEVIDKRRWETKGLATITYREGGAKRKAKVDGMVYGQFRNEDGAPAEALFERILKNFNGDLLELVDESEENAEEGTADKETDAVDGDTTDPGKPTEADEGKAKE